MLLGKRGWIPKKYVYILLYCSLSAALIICDQRMHECTRLKHEAEVVFDGGNAYVSLYGRWVKNVDRFKWTQVAERSTTAGRC